MKGVPELQAGTKCDVHNPTQGMKDLDVNFAQMVANEECDDLDAADCGYHLLS